MGVALITWKLLSPVNTLNTIQMLVMLIRNQLPEYQEGRLNAFHISRKFKLTYKLEHLGLFYFGTENPFDPDNFYYLNPFDIPPNFDLVIKSV